MTLTALYQLHKAELLLDHVQCVVCGGLYRDSHTETYVVIFPGAPTKPKIICRDCATLAAGEL